MKKGGNMELVKGEQLIEKGTGPKSSGKKIRINVKRLKGRKVLLSKYEVPEVGAPYKVSFYAKFVDWGKSFSQDEQGNSVPISTAICIDEYGIVLNVPIQFVRFV